MLYVTGACKTKREASTAAGFHPHYLTMLTAPGAGSDKVKELMEEMTNELMQKGVDMSVVMNRLGRLGLAKLAQLTVAGSNERIQLDAAKTLADRSPETAGIQKLQVDAVSLGAADAKAIAEALVESAKLSQDFDHVAKNGLVEIDLTQEQVDDRPEATGIATGSDRSDTERSAESNGSVSSVASDSSDSPARMLRLIKGDPS